MITPARRAVAFALSVCFASAAGGGGAPAATRAARQAKEFAKAKGSPADFPSAFEFELNGFSYRVATNGNGRRTKGDRTRRFNLRLESGVQIETALFFAEYEGDLLLVYNVAGGDWADGRVTRLQQPSMRALWNQDDASTNVGPPLREGRFLYVTGAGFVGKLDLRTGEYVWQHEDLYRETEVARAGVKPDDFNSFETPELAGETVLFRARPVYNRPRTLVVNKKTGKIIRIE